MRKLQRTEDKVEVIQSLHLTEEKEEVTQLLHIIKDTLTGQQSLISL